MKLQKSKRILFILCSLSSHVPRTVAIIYICIYIFPSFYLLRLHYCAHTHTHTYWIKPSVSLYFFFFLLRLHANQLNFDNKTPSDLKALDTSIFVFAKMVFVKIEFQNMTKTYFAQHDRKHIINIIFGTRGKERERNRRNVFLIKVAAHQSSELKRGKEFHKTVWANRIKKTEEDENRWKDLLK